MVGINSFFFFPKNVIKAFYIRIVSKLCGKGLSINFSKKSDVSQSFVADFSRDWSEKAGLQVKSWSAKSEETWISELVMKYIWQGISHHQFKSAIWKLERGKEATVHLLISNPWTYPHKYRKPSRILPRPLKFIQLNVIGYCHGQRTRVYMF